MLVFFIKYCSQLRQTTLCPTSLMFLSRFLPRKFLSSYSFNCVPRLRLRRSCSSTRILAFDNLDMETVNTTERLKGLRHLMSENKVDVYSMIGSKFLWKKPNLMCFKLSPLKTVINLNTSHLVMPVEVRVLDLVLGDLAYLDSVHMRLLWFCGHSCDYS